MPAIELAEWQEATPDTAVELAGMSVSADERALLAHLDRQRMLTVTERRDGISITTTSFVGSVNVGRLTVRVQPKLDGRPFSVLLGYALGLPQIELLPEHQVSLTAPAFQDLLVARLAREASRLLARGIYRSYVSQEALLGRPRGRILFSQLARTPLTAAALPCRYHERDDNVLPNRVLLSGLQLAGRLAINPMVRTSVLRPAAALAELAEPVRLNIATFRRLRRGLSRLTRSYDPAFAMIRLLMAGRGIGTSPGAEAMELPGFLFDMNRLFQNALERFFLEWLGDADLSAQHRLRDVFRYESLFNPRRKQSPTPRPDFVMSRRGRVVAIADAKYRDLWENDLSRDMLYQLSIYALSQRDCPTATILYPTTATIAREARIAINDPLTAQRRAQVCLRPVLLTELAELVTSARTAANDRRRRDYAAYLAFGSS